MLPLGKFLLEKAVPQNAGHEMGTLAATYMKKEKLIPTQWF
jgi:hypothetical protein